MHHDMHNSVHNDMHNHMLKLNMPMLIITVMNIIKFTTTNNLSTMSRIIIITNSHCYVNY